MGMKKPSSLKIAFWRFLFMQLVGLFGAVAIPFLLVTVSTTLGLTTYGDYSEIRANELAPILAATPDLSDVQIPMGIEYALLDKNYQLIETTLDENELEQAMRYATTGASDQNLQKRYLLVTRENKYIVLQYYIGVQYTNEWMNEHLPSPDIMLIVLIAVGGIFVCLKQLRRWQGRILSLRFSVTGDEGRLQISVQMQVPVSRREICCTSKNSLTWLTTAVILTCIFE